MAALLVRDHRDGGLAERLTVLRGQMAAVSGKVGAGRRGHADRDVLDSETRLPIPQALADVLPDAVPRGTVAVLSGARSLLLGMVAAVTAAGGNTVLVGQPDIGLLAAVEMGADLSRLAVIPDPGTDPVEVAAVLLDGMDVVVLGLSGRSVPPARARAVAARARHKGCTLLVTDGDWRGTAIRLQARVCGYETTCGTAVPGFGRIAGVRLQVRRVGGRAVRTPTG
ncbi:hypothetical protein MSM1_11515 [Mycobacterium sp. SM1]|uniref:hypothetical protein n=1 Tax=Mycobacterium sp. SM1 TaxID=2816243 RepID=UPI001BCC41B4|nr:hypothetical protein [Mycobacterium sp. SM1]MBS4728930.1 hypothetical protein [Mycobacterium sp. SM1]